MAARSKLVENLDSDRCLSDDEVLHDAIFYSDCSKNLQSHYSHEIKMQSAPASQVNSFTGDGHHSTIATSKEEFRQRENSTLQKEILPSKSEMINQLLDTEHGRLPHLDGTKGQLDDFGYDSISDEENDTRRKFPFTYASAGAKRGGYDNLEKKLHEACEWSTILDEADELAGLRGNMCGSFHPSLVPEERIYHKGGRRGSSKFKISLPSLSSMENFSRGSLSKDKIYSSSEEDIEGPAEWYCFKHETKEDTAPRHLEDIFQGSAEPANRSGSHKTLVGAPSVSELLEDMQNKDPSLRGIQAVDNIEGKERQMISSKRSLLHLGNRALHNKDAPDFTGEISSEDEHIDQHYRAAQIVKEQTMADLFQEAFNTSTDERPEIPKMDNIEGKERQMISSKRSLLHLGNRALHNKDAPDFTGEISSEDEHIDQHYRAAQIVKEQTMADLFQEAFNTSTDERPEIPKNNKFGFQLRLQNIIKLEKDGHMDYLKGLQPGRTPSSKQTVSFLGGNNGCFRDINLNATNYAS
ncbi:uncharacterized protein LOC110019310 [Phalaenopsis equestris]|uniref:uncharacterized protein LOC110019310 n=1 Tax=Phalaenopsis equestris TaxID=78828 RepID=UPI0009E2074A|nr:uncharacterized protein LOC110019310 [Phalaenopsis equestris]